ncbi:hypothetical protein VNO77_34109 [Canavalia gladiata]|uniref:Uncharacterized protein n=1 Tax=Canavalia gladiata TaxID=3824 RepID=A0AAN9KF17_CANGL
MANYEGQTIASGSRIKSKNMIFEPILKDGVFQYDCFVNDIDASYPNSSFVNSMNRDLLITTHKKLIEFVSELVAGRLSFYGIGEVSGQLEKMGKRVREGLFCKLVVFAIVETFTLIIGKEL